MLFLLKSTYFTLGDELGQSVRLPAPTEASYSPRLRSFPTHVSGICSSGPSDFGLLETERLDGEEGVGRSVPGSHAVAGPSVLAGTGQQDLHRQRVCQTSHEAVAENRGVRTRSGCWSLHVVLLISFLTKSEG